MIGNEDGDSRPVVKQKYDANGGVRIELREAESRGGMKERKGGQGRRKMGWETGRATEEMGVGGSRWTW